MFGVIVLIECCRINLFELFLVVKNWWLVSIFWVVELYSVVLGLLIDIFLFFIVLVVFVELVVVIVDVKFFVMNILEKIK